MNLLNIDTKNASNAIDYRLVHSYKNNLPTTQSTHLIEVDDELSATFELIKILKDQAHTNKWTVLIAPENIPSKQLLSSCSVDLKHVLVIREKQISNKLDVINNAMRHGNCSTIIAWMDVFTPEVITEVSKTAAQSKCQFYAFNKLASKSFDNTEH